MIRLNLTAIPVWLELAVNRLAILTPFRRPKLTPYTA